MPEEDRGWLLPPPTEPSFNKALAEFAEYHKNVGIDLGRAQMLREIADRDPIVAEEVRQLLARTTQ